MTESRAGRHLRYASTICLHQSITTLSSICNFPKQSSAWSVTGTPAEPEIHGPPDMWPDMAVGSSNGGPWTALSRTTFSQGNRACPYLPSKNIQGGLDAGGASSVDYEGVVAVLPPLSSITLLGKWMEQDGGRISSLLVTHCIGGRLFCGPSCSGEATLWAPVYQCLCHTTPSLFCLGRFLSEWNKYLCGSHDKGFSSVRNAMERCLNSLSSPSA